jgi:hypothetical protein
MSSGDRHHDEASSEGNHKPMTLHQHWLVTQAIKSNFDCLEARPNDTFSLYEGRIEVKRVDMKVHIQDMKYWKDK